MTVQKLKVINENLLINRNSFKLFCLLPDGKFGAYMQVHIQNDGPVTIELESPIVQDKSDNKKKESSESQIKVSEVFVTNGKN